MNIVNNKTLFPAELDLPPNNSFCSFLYLWDFNFSDFKGKVAKGDFQPLWLKGLTSG